MQQESREDAHPPPQQEGREDAHSPPQQEGPEDAHPPPPVWPQPTPCCTCRQQPALQGSQAQLCIICTRLQAIVQLLQRQPLSAAEQLRLAAALTVAVQVPLPWSQAGRWDSPWR